MDFVKKIIIFSIGAAIITILIIVFCLVPLFFELEGVTNKIVAEKKSTFSFEEEVAIAEQFEKVYSDLKLNFEKIDSFLVSSEAPIDLIKFLEGKAQKSNLLIDIHPYSIIKSEDDPWNSMGFNLELTGEFSNFLKFLEKIENSNYFIQVQKIQVKKISPEDIGAILDIKVFTK